MQAILPLKYLWFSIASSLLAIVICALSPQAAAQTSSGTSSQMTELNQNVKEVYFPFNIYNRTLDPAVLDADAAWLKQHPDAHFWIQAYADIRGDVVYNLVLSYRRAQWIKNSLVSRGVNESQIGFATGWGKLYQVCDQQDEQCFQKNRRGDMVTPELLM